MARLTRGIGIAQVKTRLPESRTATGAFVKLAGNVASVAQEKAVSEATEKAALAAQAFQFQRDGDGNLIAPTIDMKDGALGPTIYEAEYTEQLLHRYEQNTILDANKRLSDLARQFPLDPESFDAHATKYKDTVVQNTMPQLQGKVHDQIMALGLSHSTYIADNLAKWEREESLQVLDLNTERQRKDLLGMAANGADATQLQLAAQGITDEWTRAAENLLVNDAALMSVQQGITRTIAEGRIGWMATQIPPNSESEAAFIESIHLMTQDDNATIETLVDGKVVEVPFKEVFPDRADRESMIQRVTKYIGDRSRNRETLDYVRDQGEMNRWIAKNVPSILSDIESGHYVDTSRLLDTMINSVTENELLFDQVSRLKNLAVASNEETLNRRWDAANLEAGFNALDIQYGSLSPEEREAVDSLSQNILGADIMTVIDGEIDPDPLSRQQAFNHVSKILNQVESSRGSGSVPEHIKDYMLALSLYEQKYNANVADLLANAEPLEDGSQPTSLLQLSPEAQMAAQRELKRSLPGLDLNQTKAAATFHDTQYHEAWGEGSDPRLWTSWADVAPDKMRIRMADMDQIGVIPTSFQKWTMGAAQNIDGLEPDEFTRFMDYSKMLFDSDRLSGRASSGLDDRTHKAMWIMATMAGPYEREGDNEVARQMIKRVMEGENIYMDFFEAPPDVQSDIMDGIEAAFVDEYIEFLPFEGVGGDPGEVSIFAHYFTPGPGIEMAPGFRERAKQLAIAHGNFYGLETEDGRKQAMKAVKPQMIAEGWVVDSDFITSRDVDNPWPLEPFATWSDDAITDRASGVWTNQSIRSVTSDEEIIQAAYSQVEEFTKTSPVWEALTGSLKRTPKIGVNMKLVNEGLHLNENGEMEHAFVAYALDGAGRFNPIQDEENLNNRKLFFFNITAEAVQAKRDEDRRRFESKQVKNARRRAMNQLLREVQLQQQHLGYVTQDALDAFEKGKKEIDEAFGDTGQ